MTLIVKLGSNLEKYSPNKNVFSQAKKFRAKWKKIIKDTENNEKTHSI